jgi:replicative DNA helicase
MNAPAKDYPEVICNIQVEQALLGAVLHSPQGLDRIDNVVAADDFSEPVHQQLFPPAAGVAPGRAGA